MALEKTLDFFSFQWFLAGPVFPHFQAWPKLFELYSVFFLTEYKEDLEGAKSVDPVTATAGVILLDFDFSIIGKKSNYVIWLFET